MSSLLGMIFSTRFCLLFGVCGELFLDDTSIITMIIQLKGAIVTSNGQFRTLKEVKMRAASSIKVLIGPVTIRG
uniref:Uncharacterized protein n=1 Tax=Rhodnius prolixus TaxID=13249 RepID=T1HKJ4_RHOPR